MAGFIDCSESTLPSCRKSVDARISLSGRVEDRLLSFCRNWSRLVSSNVGKSVVVVIGIQDKSVAAWLALWISID